MMNKNMGYFIAFLVSFLAIWHCSYAQGKLVIIGGGKRTPAIVQKMIALSGVDKKGYIVILPMASEEQDSSIFYAKKQFVNAGIGNVVGYFIKKGDETSNTVIDSIAKAALIYIPGGDQTKFMEIIANTAVENAIKLCYSKGNVIAGTSAGAAVMSDKMITGVELNHKATTEESERQGFETIEANNIELSKGLGFLTKSIIDQHFIKRKRYNRLISVAIENPNIACMGIDEATALVVVNGKATVVENSQVIKIKNTNKTVNARDRNLSAKALVLDVYKEGDSFFIK